MGNCVVEVYTSTSMIRGVISHDPGHRLLDILNHTGLETAGNKGNFLTVLDTTICTPDNEERNIESILVNTSNIFFIKEITDDTERPFEKEISNKIYPYVSKERITIKFYMPSYSLTGKLHYSKRQDPMDVLNATTGFFALTDANISYLTGFDGSNADFLAVNRKQVLYIEPI
jgi:hypothetical protein